MFLLVGGGIRRISYLTLVGSVRSHTILNNDANDFCFVDSAGVFSTLCQAGLWKIQRWMCLTCKHLKL